MAKENQQVAAESAGGKSPLSVERLRQAFSKMLGQKSAATPPNADNPADIERTELTGESCRTERDACEINPQSIVEAMLFVGRPNAEPISSREMAAAMRGVSPREVDDAVDRLNDVYLADGAPYRITQEAAGYRLVLHDDFARIRDRFCGRVREARLSPAAIEVLSIIAYHQPVTLARIDQMRDASSSGLVRSLVRRELIHVERSPDRPRQPSYRTTPRFLKLFGLKSLAELPRNAELEAA